MKDRRRKGSKNSVLPTQLEDKPASLFINCLVSTFFRGNLVASPRIVLTECLGSKTGWQECSPCRNSVPPVYLLNIFGFLGALKVMFPMQRAFLSFLPPIPSPENSFQCVSLLKILLCPHKWEVEGDWKKTLGNETMFSCQISQNHPYSFCLKSSEWQKLFSWDNSTKTCVAPSGGTETLS